MLGFLLRAALAAAVFATVVYVVGMITRSTLKEQLQPQGIKHAVIDRIDRCGNVVRLKDIDSGKVLEVRGDDVSSELNNGDHIYIGK